MTLFYRCTYTTLCTLTALGTSLLLPSFHALADVEFLHWWTSKGEQKALTILEDHLSKSPQEITTSSVLGGGGDSAMTVLQARALAGNTPSFAQIEGPSIKAWDAIGILHSINDVGIQNNWDEVLYPLSITKIGRAV
ncbi:ABC transporter substrate-binding protein, partial [Vibrio genomosp. F10 str. 9ZD137]